MGAIACGACGARSPEFDVRCRACGAELPSVSVGAESGEAGAAAATDELVGREIGPYTVEGRLGVGAMGVVYRAVDSRLRRPVALKVLSVRLSRDDRARARMVREARAAGQLDHPGIATVYEIGDFEGRPYIAMALYEGATLKDEIARGPAPIRRAARVALDLASALAAAHAAGIVHRDVKPANVAVTPGGAVRILDFGLAKLDRPEGGDAALLTRRGAVLGTVGYMSPEQRRGDPVDVRADLWALGVILYELCTGRLPTDAERSGESPVDLAARREDAPASLSAVVARLLEPDVERRLASAEEAARLLGATLAELEAAPPPAPEPPLAEPAALAPGLVVAERFRLVREVGRGSMGAVWMAEHLGLGVRCAIKFIRDDCDQGELWARFEAEARAVASLTTRYVVRVIDHGVWRGRPYMAMEHLEGETLRERLARDGRLSPEETARIVAQVARGLGKAHAAGIVHRDVKPENVFLTSDDEGEVAKIFDFGVAKAARPDGAVGSTHGRGLLGTPAYMSPEQTNGAVVDHRSDLWSVAVVAFECVTGRRPFDSEALGELFVRILSKPLPVPTEVAPDVPPGLDAWWLRAAARDPERRFQSATGLADGFAEAVSAGGPRVDRAIAVEPAESAPAEDAGERTRGRGRSWLAIGASVAVVVFALSVVAFAGRGGGPEPVAPPVAEIATAPATATAAADPPGPVGTNHGGEAGRVSGTSAPVGARPPDEGPERKTPPPEPARPRRGKGTAAAPRPPAPPPATAASAGPARIDPSLLDRRD